MTNPQATAYDATRYTIGIIKALVSGLPDPIGLMVLYVISEQVQQMINEYEQREIELP